MTRGVLGALIGSKPWRKFSRNPLSVFGLALVLAIVFVALAAPLIAPFPEHAGPGVDFANMFLAPDGTYLLGSDDSGRDLLSRIFFGYRLALLLALAVLAIVTPLGVALGLAAGYFGGWIEAVIMRVTDVFLSIPPLVLAMAIMGFLEPTLFNGMMAVSAMWWPWYTRLAYNQARAVSREDFVTAARVIGAGHGHMLFREILPNCLPSVFTKMTLDVGFVILIAASLSFLGLGVQPPTPDLGSMVSKGAQYLPDFWWMTIYPALAILLVVLGFNLLGDGIRDALDQD